MSGADAATLSNGTRLGAWIIDRPLWPGRDGVMLARHATEEDRWAMIEAWPDAAMHRARHRRALTALRSLDHECVPQLLDSGSDNGLLWIASDPGDGELLADLLVVSPIDWRDAYSIIVCVARALAAAHAAGISHRNVSPERIVVGADWSARLIGWDLAMDDEALGQAANPPFGPLQYVAPEVIAQPLTHGPRADLYALGIVFYEILVGRSPFPAAAHGGDRPEAAARLLELKTRAEPLQLAGHAPPWIEQLVAKATHAQVEKRLPDVEAFLGWIEAAAGAWGRAGARPSLPPASRQLAPALPALEPRLASRALAASVRQPVGPDPFWMLVAGVGGGIAGLLFTFLVVLVREFGVV